MFVKIENKNIYYKFFNENLLQNKDEIIIFLHEGLGSVGQWFDFPQKLCDKLQLPGLAYDRYGFGKSDELKEERPDNYLWQEADFLLKLIGKLNINKKIILFGHSDGGTLALLFASIHNTSDIAYVVSIAHHVVIEKETVEGMEKAVEAYENGKLRHALSKFHPGKVDSMFYAWAKFKNFSKDFDIKELLTDIKAPVLALQGEDDQYGTPEQLVYIEKYVKNSETHLIPSCNHYPHRKCEDTVLDLVAQFHKRTSI